jgi:Mg-chelatase subunit ChlD
VIGPVIGPVTGPGHDERMRRWRLVLGGEGSGEGVPLAGDDARADAALGALYDSDAPDGRAPLRRAGLGASAPGVARWLGDIRAFFPVSAVQVMQRDAIERLGLTRLLLEPEMLDAVEPDVHLVGTLLSLSRVIPEQARESARAVVRTVTRDLERRLAQRTRSAVTGALNRASRAGRPKRAADIDWDRTIRANLRNYLPLHRTVVPERLVGYARKQQAVARDIILCLDQSGSMAPSVVYAGVFGAVLASIPSLRTSVVAFDTSVVDLTGLLSDPVEVLFGIQLGGGTDINRALGYAQRLVTRPASTILILVSDLFEGGNRDEMLRRIADLTAAGTQVIVLLALSDDGAPGYDHDNAAALAQLGVPAFACTPDSFPDLMAAAINHRDITEWAHRRLSAAGQHPASRDPLVGGQVMLVQQGEARGQERRGLAGAQEPLGREPGANAPGLGRERFPAEQPAIGDGAGGRAEDGGIPEKRAQDECVRARRRPPGRQIAVNQRDQVVKPAPPGLLAEQPERYVRYVDCLDPASLRRGKQDAARRTAGEVGYRPVRQVQRQRLDGQRMRRE